MPSRFVLLTHHPLSVTHGSMSHLVANQMWEGVIVLDAIVRLMVDAVYKQSGVLHMLVNSSGFVQLCSCKFINGSFISN